LLFAGYGYSTYKIGIDADANISSEELNEFATELNERYVSTVSRIGLAFLEDKLTFDAF
jgi:hypothetical protein